MGDFNIPGPRYGEYLTPPAIMMSLPLFDLDPCAPIRRPWDTARRHFSVNGLDRKWFGRVWLNPPYGRGLEKWIARLAEHGNGIALVFARTDTQFFHNHIFSKAHGILFLEKRLSFYDIKGNRHKHRAPAPSALISYGEDCGRVLRVCRLPGKFIELRKLDV